MSFNVGDRVVSISIFPSAVGTTEGKIIAIHGATAWVLFDGETIPRSALTSLLAKANLKVGDRVKLASNTSPSWRATVIAVNDKYAWVRADGNSQPMTYLISQLARA